MSLLKVKDKDLSEVGATEISCRRPLNFNQAVVPCGRVYTIPNRCKGCNYCIEFCPKDVLEASRDMNAKGYHYPVVTEGKEDACIHCQFCDLICPEMAIYTKDGQESP